MCIGKTIAGWGLAGRVVALFTAMLLSHALFAQPKGVDARAETLLQNAMTYLASQQAFSVDTGSSIEVVLTSGQKIQFDHAARVSVQRPDKLRAERLGDLVDQVFFYDGRNLTLHNPADHYFATVPAPDTLEAMLDFARDSLDIVAPAGDLVYKDAFAILMQDVTSGFVVGKSAVGGVPCHHLAFRGAQVDWQIWIQEGNQPLPRKMVITSTDILSHPQFTVVMNRWDLGSKFDHTLFTYTPSEGDEGIEFHSIGGRAFQSE